MSLSIRQYAFLFVLLTLLMIVGFTSRSYIAFENTRQKIEHSQQVAANKELLHTLRQSLQGLSNKAAKFTQWEEVHQQLDNPAYFAYWYNVRVRQTSEELIQLISDIMIYDAEGNALARFSDNKLPYSLETKPDKESYFLDSQQSQIFTLPIYNLTDSTKITGYLSVRINLIDLLKQQASFYYVQPDSLSLQPEAIGKQLASVDAGYIHFNTLKTQEILQLEKQLRDSITEMIILVILPALVLYSLLVYIISKPINSISDYLEKLRISPGYNDDFKYQNFFEVKELQNVSQSLRSYHSELFDTNAILDEKNKALWDQAHHDALTGAYNRRAFDDQWENLNDLLAEHRVNISFILFDVNLFKSINDTHGHQVGDQVLQTIAKCIIGSLRKGEHLFRLGGDEFASFLIDSSTQTAIDVAQRCLDNIAAFPFETIGMPEPVRVSIGISQASSDDEDSLKNLQWQADAAMYAAKRPGTADIIVYDDEITEDSKGLLSSWLSNTVYQAIDKGTGLVLFYQPIIDFNQSKISYFEALVRIQANGELISPASIFNVVEARRFEVELDRAVIRRLTEDLKQGKIPDGTGVSLNLSAPTLTKTEIVEWLKPLQEFTAQYKIVLEVTETALITEIQKVTQHLKKLGQMSFTIALDDFGSGYSSVKYLASMPVDIVKFDITLVQCLLDEKQRLMITRLAQMIEEAGHHLVAEGIEDKAMLELVIASGFHYGQGYMFGKPEEVPRPQEVVEEILLENHSSFRQLVLHQNF